MTGLAFFCYVYLAQPGRPCILGEWLPRSTIVLHVPGGSYDSEDTNLNRRRGARR